MRVTQFMMADSYTNRLGKVMEQLEDKGRKVDTGRRFFRGSQDPEGAAKSYMYRRHYKSAEDHLENTKDMKSLIETRESSMMQVKKTLDDTMSSLMRVLNGDKNTPDIKNIIAKQFRAAQKSIVMDMNVKYGDKFLFGGSAVSEPPFKLSEDGKTLTYRGVGVSGNQDFTWPEGSPMAGQQVKTKAKLMELLNKMSKDEIYADLGFGMKFDATGKMLDSSGYNFSAPGINVIGYGTKKDGTAKNAVELLGQIASALERNAGHEELSKFLEPLKDAPNNILKSITKMGSESKFLENTQTRLESLKDNLHKKISDVENVEAEKAIMDLNKTTFMYKAMLKTSASILSGSFIDFMR